MIKAIKIDIPIDRIREYCATQPIMRLSVFGSAARDELTPESDIDLLWSMCQGRRSNCSEWRDICERLAKSVGAMLTFVRQRG
jgi:predicted nucleotidyltransferase